MYADLPIEPDDAYTAAIFPDCLPNPPTSNDLAAFLEGLQRVFGSRKPLINQFEKLGIISVAQLRSLINNPIQSYEQMKGFLKEEAFQATSSDSSSSEDSEEQISINHQKMVEFFKTALLDIIEESGDDDSSRLLFAQKLLTLFTGRPTPSTEKVTIVFHDNYPEGQLYPKVQSCTKKIFFPNFPNSHSISDFKKDLKFLIDNTYDKEKEIFIFTGED